MNDKDKSLSNQQAETETPRSGPPTSEDVARLAQVSRATVSYVLNNVQDARISEATKERVLQAAAELGYIPHKAASSLRSGHSDLVLLPFFDWPYNQSSITFLQEMALYLDEMGYTVMLRFFHRGEKSQIASKIAASHPIGVIVTADELSKEDVELLSRNGVRAILAYQGSPTPYLPSIAIDFRVVGECAGDYLIGRGHKNLAVIVPKDKRIIAIGLQRLDGVKRAGEKHGIPVERADLEFDPQEAAALAKKWAKGKHPNAVFTYNDEYGGLLMSALQDENLQVPGDIALVGCDDLPLCDMLRPRLTSINLGSGMPAHYIAEYFHSMIQGEALEKQPEFSLACHLVVRESS